MKTKQTNDDKRNIAEVIEDDVKQLKNCRYADEKTEQYKVITDGLKVYFKQTNLNRFRRDLIYSFIDEKVFPKSTREKHQKAILSTLKQRGLIKDDSHDVTATQQRVYSLKSNDFDGSYSAMMWGNGYSEATFYNWECDSDGVPRKYEVGRGGINQLPTDSDGEAVEEWGCSTLNQTIPREKQGVYSYGSKSIANEKRSYSRKCFKVIA